MIIIAILKLNLGLSLFKLSVRNLWNTWIIGILIISGQRIIWFSTDSRPWAEKCLLLLLSHSVCIYSSNLIRSYYKVPSSTVLRMRTAWFLPLQIVVTYFYTFPSLLAYCNKTWVYLRGYAVITSVSLMLLRIVKFILNVNNRHGVQLILIRKLIDRHHIINITSYWCVNSSH